MARKKAKEVLELGQVLEELRAGGKPGTAAIYGRHGVRDVCWGVAYSLMDKLQKRIRQDHDLARELWATKVHEARILALKVADPEGFTPGELGRMLRQVSDRVVMGALGSLVARRADGETIARRWIDGKGEWRRAAGWVALSSLANQGRLDGEAAASLLERIGKTLHAGFDRERYHMNNCLIAIGGTMESLHSRAVEIAEALGPVEVDHGATGCKTPAAIPYMERMWAR